MYALVERVWVTNIDYFFYQDMVKYVNSYSYSMTLNWNSVELFRVTSWMQASDKSNINGRSMLIVCCVSLSLILQKFFKLREYKQSFYSVMQREKLSFNKILSLIGYSFHYCQWGSLNVNVVLYFRHHISIILFYRHRHIFQWWYFLFNWILSVKAHNLFARFCGPGN